MPRVDQYIFYRNALKKHGPGAEGVAWADTARQHRRFEVLLKAVDDLPAATIVDAGCGVGDLWLYMRRTRRFPKRYIGLDSHPDMVALAKARTDQTILRRDLLGDPLPRADWYLASGTLNLLTRFETLLAIKRCFDAARKGIVFNLLKGDDRSDTYNYWQPREMIATCRSLGSVTLYEGYLEGDFTLKITA